MKTGRRKGVRRTKGQGSSGVHPPIKAGGREPVDGVRREIGWRFSIGAKGEGATKTPKEDSPLNGTRIRRWKRIRRNLQEGPINGKAGASGETVGKGVEKLKKKALAGRIGKK